MPLFHLSLIIVTLSSTDNSINRLQRVQNSLARAVAPSCKRFHHIAPTLTKLHWLYLSKKGLHSKLLQLPTRYYKTNNHRIFLTSCNITILQESFDLLANVF